MIPISLDDGRLYRMLSYIRADRVHHLALLPVYGHGPMMGVTVSSEDYIHELHAHADGKGLLLLDDDGLGGGVLYMMEWDGQGGLLYGKGATIVKARSR